MALLFLSPRPLPPSAPRLNRKDIVKTVSSATGVPVGVVDPIVIMFIRSIVDALSHGRRVSLRHLGSWHLTETRPHFRRDLRTNSEGKIAVPARMTVRFTPCVGLRHSVNGEGEVVDLGDAAR